MRWIFITLTFINLLALAYFWQSQETEVVQQQPLDLVQQGKNIVLISELSEAPARIAKSANSNRSELCYMAGPFEEQIDGRHVLARAAALGFNGQLKEVKVDTDKPAEYWVYVPPRPSREQALSTLRELQKRNYDSYIITQGEMSEGVSLGLFRNKDSAYGLQKKVQATGIDVEVKVVNESTNEYWVEIKETAQLSESMRNKIKANDAELRWEMVECR